MEKFRDEEQNWAQRIDALSAENSRQKERLEGQSTTDALRRMGPFLQSIGTSSVAWEMMDLFYGKKNTITAPPSSIASVSDIQKCVLQFCSHFLTNSIPFSWTVHKGARNESGHDVTSSEDSWTIAGTMGGIRGAELKVMNFETMVRVVVYKLSCCIFLAYVLMMSIVQQLFSTAAGRSPSCAGATA